MLLENKTAVVYGGGGAIGGAAPRAFAREGARVHLAGRTPAKLEAVARDIQAEVVAAEVAVLDAVDQGAVHEHADAVATQAGDLIYRRVDT
jgi:NADP-dependent 3-hydroxy acid dehydrogenase YdfG